MSRARQGTRPCSVLLTGDANPKQSKLKWRLHLSHSGQRRCECTAFRMQF
jgi:hypothetical protein